MANGSDPERVSLRDWLDAGYVMLVEGADAVARQLLDELFRSDTDEALERNFGALRAEVSYRNEQSARQDREARKRSGGPNHVRIIPQQVLDDAVDEWRQITGKPPAAEVDEPV